MPKKQVERRTIGAGTDAGGVGEEGETGVAAGACFAGDFAGGGADLRECFFAISVLTIGIFFVEKYDGGETAAFRSVRPGNFLETF